MQHDGVAPVLLVHGWTGSPDGWRAPISHRINQHITPLTRSLAAQVERLPGADPWLLDYHAASTRWVSDPEVGGAVASAIDCLHDAYGAKVTVVAHSMGGLATRWALGRDERHDKVAAVVTLGTPHNGSDIAAGVGALLTGGEVYGMATANLPVLTLTTVIRVCGLLTADHADACAPLPSMVAGFDSPAGRALRTGSNELAELPAWPRGLPVLALAGDVQLVTKTSSGLFYHRVRSDSLGDLVVSVPSATAQGTESWTGTCRHDVKWGYAIDKPLRKVLGTYYEDPRDRSLWQIRQTPCFHGHLSRTVEITNQALGFIGEHLPDGTPEWDLVRQPELGYESLIFSVATLAGGVLAEGSTLSEGTGFGLFTTRDGREWAYIPGSEQLTLLNGRSTEVLAAGPPGLFVVTPEGDLKRLADVPAGEEAHYEAAFRSGDTLFLLGWLSGDDPAAMAWRLDGDTWTPIPLPSEEPATAEWILPGPPIRFVGTSFAGDWMGITMWDADGRPLPPPEIRSPSGRVNAVLANGTRLVVQNRDWPVGDVSVEMLLAEGDSWASSVPSLHDEQLIPGGSASVHVDSASQLDGRLLLAGGVSSWQCEMPDLETCVEVADKHQPSVWTQTSSGWVRDALPMDDTYWRVHLAGMGRLPDGRVLLAGTGADPAGEHWVPYVWVGS